MKKNRNILLLLSALLVSGSVMISCGNTVDNAQTTQDALAETTEPAVIMEETEGLDFEYPVFEGLDYEGHVFNIYLYEWGMFREYFVAEEQYGEVLNDTLWNREQKVLETLNVDIEYQNPDGISFNLVSRIKTQVMAGDHTYDLFLTHCCMEVSTISAEGYLYNFNHLPNIDLSQPYWNQNMQQTLSIGDFLPVAFGDYMIPDPDVIFFNKQLLANYDLASPYELVKNGTWTWDMLIEMSSAATQDINGDGTMDENDQYGFMAELDWQFNGIMQSTGEYLISRGSDDSYSFNPLSEKTVNMMAKLNDFLYASGDAYTWPYSQQYDVNNGAEPPVSFKNGNALFFMVPMNTASNYRETEVDFGILPFPKYDEAQETYQSLNWSGLMGVPSNVENPERTGAVLELLNAEGRASVLPVYYDIVLTSKISRDEESAEMLDIIFDNTVFDFGMTYQPSSDLFYMYPNVLKKKSADVASFYDSKIKVAEKSLDKFLEKIAGVIDNQ